MTVPVVLVDAFAQRPFEGNPAAVCLLEQPADASWMQAVAAEVNLSETAFLVPDGEGWHLRWFSPTTEIGLCGHATLASAHALWQEFGLDPETSIRFRSASGDLVAVRVAGRIDLDFPAEPVQRIAAPFDLEAALGVEPVQVLRGRVDLLVELGSAGQVEDLHPDMGRLASLPGQGVIVTALDDSGTFDFVSRYFAPAVGIDEDPVTGAAHCALGPFWSGRLGRSSLVGRQLSRRGGTVFVLDRGTRVTLSGQARTFLRGEIEAGDE